MTVGFAFSGGGNLGPVQAGAVLALFEAGIEPDVLVGASVGALNAAFLASQPGVEGARALVQAWSALRRRQVATLNPLAALAGLGGLRGHLFSAARLTATIKAWVQIDRIEQAPRRVAAVATDALTGECVLLQSGDPVTALAASAAIPGVFPPVRIDGRWLIDGSLSAGWPVLQAQQLDATEIYIITTVSAQRLRPPRGAIAMAMNSVSLVTARMNQQWLALAENNAAADGGRIHVVPTGDPPAPSPYDFTGSAALAAAGYRAAKAWLDSARPPSLL